MKPRESKYLGFRVWSVWCFGGFIGALVELRGLKSLGCGELARIGLAQTRGYLSLQPLQQTTRV